MLRQFSDCLNASWERLLSAFFGRVAATVHSIVSAAVVESTAKQMTAVKAADVLKRAVAFSGRRGVVFRHENDSHQQESDDNGFHCWLWMEDSDEASTRAL